MPSWADGVAPATVVRVGEDADANAAAVEARRAAGDSAAPRLALPTRRDAVDAAGPAVEVIPGGIDAAGATIRQAGGAGENHALARRLENIDLRGAGGHTSMSGKRTAKQPRGKYP
jgi:hypothetical protein